MELMLSANAFTDSVVPRRPGLGRRCLTPSALPPTRLVAHGVVWTVEAQRPGVPFML